MSNNNPPYDATVKNIRLLCEELRDVSGMDEDDLEDEIEGLQGSTFDRNLEAAVKLGLFEETTEGEYKPTTAGKKIGYNRLSETEEEELFRELVKEYNFYSELLEIVGGELTSREGEQFLERDVVQSEIGINFDLGVGDRTLESAAGTFLQILDECGVGEYKRGHSQKHPTRLVVNEEYSEFLSAQTGDDQSEGSSEPVQDKLPTDDETESKSNEELSKQETEDDEPIPQTDVQDKDNPEDEQLDVSQRIEAGDAVEVNINIDISSSDWNSDEVASLIDTLRSEE